MSGWNTLAADILPADSTARFHLSEIDQIMQCVEDGVYCAVLGPRLCGKTEVLRQIEQILLERYGLPCIYIDLNVMRSSSLTGFFSELIRLTAGRFSQLTGIYLPAPDESETSSAVFRAFLADCVQATGQDVVMIIEHLETVPADLVQALLTSLRAAYMDQQTQDQRVTVVVSGALSLATLTVGESSPFRGIARRVFIKDLSLEDSRAFLLGLLQEYNLDLTPKAQERLLQAASGDTYLIDYMSRRAAELGHRTTQARLGARTIQRIMSEFLREEVYQYAPLLDAVRLIEEDPELMRCILLLLEKEIVPKAELPLPLSPDLDPLYLTGVVDEVGDQNYRIQNLIYCHFLGRHFVPGRVGHMLAMTGNWDLAIDQLELAAHSGDRQSRAELLPAIINSVYAAQDLRQAAHFLTRGLSAAFGVSQARVWYAPPQENRLRLVGQWGSNIDPAEWVDSEMLLGADRLEARAFRFGVVLRGAEQGGQVVRAIPLIITGRAPIGVVTVWDQPSSRRFSEQRERDLNLLGFLRQATRALYAVSLRRQELMLAGRLQASLMPDSAPHIPGWQISAGWRPARETAGDFYDFIPFPDGRLGLVIADVADKGMGAALYMALSRTLIRTFAVENPDHPEQALQLVNSRMLSDADTGHFVTLFYGILDPVTGCLCYCNAGHNPPFFFSATQESSLQMLQRTGPALGVIAETSWDRQELYFLPGDLLFIYTDGVLDAANHHRQEFGQDRIVETITRLANPSAQDVQDALISAVRAFTADEPQFDDITLMVVLRDV